MVRTGISLLVFAFVASTAGWSDEPVRPQIADKQQRVSPKLLNDALELPEYQAKAPELKPPVPTEYQGRASEAKPAALTLDDLQKLAERLKKNNDSEGAALLERFILEQKSHSSQTALEPTGNDSVHTIYVEVFEVDFDKIAADSILRDEDHSISSKEIYAELHLLFAERPKLFKLKKVRLLAHYALVQRGFNQPARFFDGGEFPLPVPGNDDAQTVEFREFGQMLETNLTPLGKDRIRLQLTCEISDKDLNAGVTVNGVNIPGIIKRKIQSTTDMNLNEWTLTANGSSTNGRQLFLMAKVSPEK